MFRDNEVLACDLKSLTGETGEVNFEMIRAQHWQKKQRPAEDRAFDALVSLVTDPCEVCFEMIHMVQYAKKRVHPTVFEAWNPSHLFAEFWIQGQAQTANRMFKPHEKRPLQCHQSTQVEVTDLPVPESVSDASHEKTTVEHFPGVDRLHRAVPGFRSILQCGSNTLYGDITFTESEAVASTTMTPTTARINRLFQESATGFTESHIGESPITTEVVTSKPTVQENTPTTERINRMFQETSINSTRLSEFRRTQLAGSDDAENDPPLVMDLECRHKTDVEPSLLRTDKPPTSSVHQNSRPDCIEDVKHSGSSSGLIPHMEHKAQPNFAIFYDPLGLETKVQNSPNIESSANPIKERNQSLLSNPNPMSVNTSTTPALTTARPIEVQISSRDPRLRAKQTMTPVETVPNPGPISSGTMLFDWLERNRNVSVIGEVDPDESVVGARNSLAMQSPTTFFRCISRRNTDRTE